MWSLRSRWTRSRGISIRRRIGRTGFWFLRIEVATIRSQQALSVRRDTPDALAVLSTTSPVASRRWPRRRPAPLTRRLRFPDQTRGRLRSLPGAGNTASTVSPSGSGEFVTRWSASAFTQTEHWIGNLSAGGIPQEGKWRYDPIKGIEAALRGRLAGTGSCEGR